jgi:catechol 2,3-dioxygenase-like lactoylglutathione lyase family enzyme
VAGAGKISISLASIVSDDIVGLSGFYATVFDLPEVVELRSDIFRGLDVSGVTLGFSTPVVYELLKMEPWRDAKGTKQYLTFEAVDDADVDRLTAAAVAQGATLLHDPYETYYGAWQAVLADPDGNVFRINHFR